MSKILPIFLCFVIGSIPLSGEAFGNNIVSIPKVGVTFFDGPLHVQKPWGIDRQWSIGTGYMQALDYRWWWVIDTTFAMGTLNFGQQDYIVSFMGGGGLRYNIFVEDFRPHTGLMLHYVQFLGDGVEKLPLNIDWPIFVGLKPYFGMEWLFYSEMALSLEVAYGLYVNIHEPFRHILYAHSSFSLYF